MGSYRCVFIGEGALLVQCAERMLALGHDVDCVVADDNAISTWAAGRGFECFGFEDGIAALPDREPVDLLFSVVNLRMLPPGVLGIAKRAAINFHDGPLPSYAGLNVTSSR